MGLHSIFKRLLSYSSLKCLITLDKSQNHTLWFSIKEMNHKLAGYRCLKLQGTHPVQATSPTKSVVPALRKSEHSQFSEGLTDY